MVDCCHRQSGAGRHSAHRTLLGREDLRVGNWIAVGRKVAETGRYCRAPGSPRRLKRNRTDCRGHRARLAQLVVLEYLCSREVKANTQDQVCSVLPKQSCVEVLLLAEAGSRRAGRAMMPDSRLA